MNRLQVNGFSMSYEKWGEGENTLLLIHGNLGSKQWWNLVKEELASHFTVYMVDLRGCGQSEKPTDGYSVPQYGEDVVSFIKQMGISHFSLVGHSMGGVIAMDVASKIPDQVDKLILLNPAPADGFVTSEDKYQIIEQYSTNRELLKSALTAVVPKGAHTPLFLDLVEDAWNSTHTAIPNAQSLGTIDYSEWAATFAKPTLLLFGEQDVLISLEDMKRTIECFKDGKLITHPGVGHSPQVEDPEWFVRETLEFLLTKK
ncbi:alpha/beta fold hydrolase [Ammoniphilus sp. CFH 90114]|uniref:alpha/beta fold hydrolase n=1 Tax=Ammoniphilus sp. CFH 90114 TaxID=2493665 RepID=UPI00100F4E2F|nr:alpha/beta hydrolase [Ammoniphilus sp. CFH 90114]RXT04306.1 alpha/beta hydrolase [Ammoniphilus sp. CFH 90114]